MMTRAVLVRLVGGAALLLCVLTLLLWWPGVVPYDGVEQYRQLLSGQLDDWHPPVMARLWMLLHPFGDGAAPMFLLQIGFYWLGFGLVAVALARAGRFRAAVAALVIAACPLFMAWQAAVIKDAQLVAALLAAIGIIGRWRLADRPLPIMAGIAIAVLLAYATLVRANAVFATIPLAVLLPEADWPKRARLMTAIVATLLLLGLGPQINHRVLGAATTSVDRVQPIYDLVGIGHFAPASAPIGLTAAERKLVERRHCYKPFFWDPLGDDDRCGAIAARLDSGPLRPLVTDWLEATILHPVAYAEHRLAHLNSTERLFVPLHWPDAAPPMTGEANTLGLGPPGPGGIMLAKVGGMLAETPLGWPIAWLPVTVTALWIALRRARSGVRDLALALAVSALTLEASFALVSIASDLRYHLWSMLATALAAVLLGDGGPWPRRPLLLGGIALALTVTLGTVARLALPPVVGDYQAMLG